MIFKSLKRKGIAYRIIEGYHSEYINNVGLHSNVKEFLTYNDGLVQHSPDNIVSENAVLDFLSSLAIYLVDNPDQIKSLCKVFYLDYLDKNLLTFLSKLKYKEDKKIYYSFLERKISSNYNKRHDVRWSEVDPWMDGSLKSIITLYNLNNNYIGFLRKLHNFFQILEFKNTSIDLDFFGLKNIRYIDLEYAYKVVWYLIEAEGYKNRAKRILDCLKNNYINKI